MSDDQKTYIIADMDDINEVKNRVEEVAAGIVGGRGTGTGSEVFNSSNNAATGNYSHAEGYATAAEGTSSHAEGQYSKATGTYSHAEGYYTTASAPYSHAEGYYAAASGTYSHAEGYYTAATGNYGSHAEGFSCKANGQYSHAEGNNTIAASQNQHVEGRYNLEDTANKYVHIIGNGNYGARSNAHTVDWNGNAWFAGDMRGKGIVINSSTEGSTKAFRITVDDSGNLSVQEYIG